LTRQSSTCTPACGSEQGKPELKGSPQERTWTDQGKQAEAEAEAADGKKPAQFPACPTFKQKSKFDFTFCEAFNRRTSSKSFQSDLVPHHISPTSPHQRLKVKTSIRISSAQVLHTVFNKVLITK
jgi:hypothetical protein